MGAMSGQAVGVYLSALIEAQPGISESSVTSYAGVAKNYIYRLRTGDTKDPSAQVLVLLVQGANGRLGTMARLITHEFEDEEAEGRAAAEEDLKPFQAVRTNELNEEYTHEHLVERLKVISAQLDDEEDAAFIQAILSLIDGWWLRIQRLRLLPLRRRKTT